MFACPRGCMESFGGLRKFETFGGWKRHMTTIHGGASLEELEAMNQQLGVSSQATKTPEQLHLDAGGTMPQEPQLDEHGNVIEPTAEPTQQATEQVKQRKPRSSAEQKRINKEINDKIRETQQTILDTVPNALFDFLARKDNNDLWKLSEEQVKVIRQSLETGLMAIGFDWQIEQWNVVVKSPMWLILYPLAVIAFIFLQKKRQIGPMEPPPEQEQQ